MYVQYHSVRCGTISGKLRYVRQESIIYNQQLFVGAVYALRVVQLLRIA